MGSSDSEERKSELRLVQEEAESGQGLPSDCYILRDQDRPQTETVPLASDIPVIDLSHLHLDEEADKLDSAVQSWGVFQAIGHDLSPSFLDQVRDVARKFFQLPREVKEKYSNLAGGEYTFEGYGNDPIRMQDQIIDWNDRLYLQVLPEHKRKLDQWPDNPCTFSEILHEYTMKTRKIADLTILALAKLLKLDENYFVDELGETAEVYARFNYYPKCSRPDLVFGLKPHSDGSVITILLPDKEVEGLQVLRDGGWVKVPIIPHALLINMGNQMEIMSNGIFKSPVHRVVTSSDERMSVVMFYALDGEKILEPAQGLIGETRPCLYRKMKTKDFLELFFKKFSQGVTTIEWQRV